MSDDLTSDGDRSKGDAPIVHRTSADTIPGLNDPDSSKDADNQPGGFYGDDNQKTNKLPTGMTQADVDKAQDRSEPDSDFDIPPNPQDVNRFADLLMKCKDSGWRIPITPVVANQAVKSAEKLTEAFLVENPALFRLLMAPMMNMRLRLAFLKSMGMNRTLRARLYRMNPQAFKSGNFTPQQKSFIQKYTNQAQASGAITPRTVKQTAKQVKDNPEVAQALGQARKSTLWGNLGKIATVGTLGWLGYEAYKALFGGEEQPEMEPGGAAGGDGSTGTGQKPSDPAGDSTTQPCLNPQEIADLDKMAASWSKVNDPGIKALVAA